MDYSKYDVLQVDDVPLNNRLVRCMLSRYNFNLRTALGGQEALDAIAERKPDLVLLNWHMPDPDGMEVLKKIRSNEATRDIRVIMVSAAVMDSCIEEAFKNGVDDFVMKPIVMEKLYSAVKKQIEIIESKSK